jgi:hypothetical protein
LLNIILIPISFIMEQQKYEVEPQPQVTLKVTSDSLTETTKIAWKLPNFRSIVESSEDLDELSEKVVFKFETGKSVRNRITANIIRRYIMKRYLRKKGYGFIGGKVFFHSFYLLALFGFWSLDWKPHKLDCRGAEGTVMHRA